MKNEKSKTRVIGVQHLAPDEITKGFLQLDPQHTFYKALLGLLDNAVAAEQEAVTIPHLTDGARHFNAGRLAFAKDVRALVDDTMTGAHRELAERNEKERLLQERQKASEG